MIDHLALVMTIALQITLFFVGAELFTDFYNEGEHAASARYLYFGLDGHAALTPWIWTALMLLAVAALIGSIHPAARHPVTLNLACLLTVIGIWIEKGHGHGRARVRAHPDRRDLRVQPRAPPRSRSARHLGHRPAAVHAAGQVGDTDRVRQLKPPGGSLDREPLHRVRVTEGGQV